MMKGVMHDDCHCSENIKNMIGGKTLNTTNNEFKVIKFFSPLKIQTYDDGENEPSEITSSMAICYAKNIMKAIEKSRIPCETDKGLMEYFDENKIVAEKVTYAYPTVEEYNGELFGVLVTHVKGELDDDEVKILTDYFSGQYADGYAQKSIMQSRSGKVA